LDIPSGFSHDCITFARAPSDAALIEEYVNSPALHTSFLPSDKDETGIHGPFMANQVKPSDFVLLTEAGLEYYLESAQLL
jgi:hypothetical protein